MEYNLFYKKAASFGGTDSTKAHMPIHRYVLPGFEQM